MIGSHFFSSTSRKCFITRRKRFFFYLECVHVGSLTKVGVVLAYRRCSTRVIVHKSLGGPISVEHSVRQGFPLCPLLFCLYIETMCLKILRNGQICGVRLDQFEVTQRKVDYYYRGCKAFSVLSVSIVNWSYFLEF